jgi:hypothetical protein
LRTIPEAIKAVDKETLEKKKKYLIAPNIQINLPVNIHIPNRIHVAGDNLRIK